MFVQWNKELACALSDASYALGRLIRCVKHSPNIHSLYNLFLIQEGTNAAWLDGKNISFAETCMYLGDTSIETFSKDVKSIDDYLSVTDGNQYVLDDKKYFQDILSALKINCFDKTEKNTLDLLFLSFSNQKRVPDQPLVIKMAINYWNAFKLIGEKPYCDRIVSLWHNRLVNTTNRSDVLTMGMSKFFTLSGNNLIYRTFKEGHNKDFQPWVKFFLSGALWSANYYVKSLDNSDQEASYLFKKYGHKVREGITYTLQWLLSNPYVRVYNLCETYNLSYSTPNRICNKMLDGGDLQYATLQKRDRVFVSPALLRIWQ